jgi:Flp pilus assembly protein TadD
MTSEQKLAQAKKIFPTDPDKAMSLCSEIINDELDTDLGHAALFMTGFIMLKAERYGMAFHIYCRCAELKPHMSQVWQNMGVCLEHIDEDQAIKCFRKSRKLNKDDPYPLANEGLIHLKD